MKDLVSLAAGCFYATLLQDACTEDYLWFISGPPLGGETVERGCV